MSFLVQNYNSTDIGEFVNVGTDSDLQIKVLAEIIKEIVGFKGEIMWDASKIRALGWEPKIHLAEGIKRVYNWYLENLNKE